MMATRYPAQGLYYGNVVHWRRAPKKHILKYRVFSILIDLEKLDELGQTSWILSIDKFNLISLYRKDYGDASGLLSQYVKNEVKTRYPDLIINQIFLLTMPRVLGYVFNPLSVYFCYDSHESLRAIVYEVSNTFGQRHNYVFDIEKSGGIKYTHECLKSFYVSPFLDMDLKYKFTIIRPAETFFLTIQAFKNSGVVMSAVQNMTYAELSNANLARVFIAIPLMTFKVIAGIHLEALKLWLKGLRLVPNTSPVDKATRFIRNERR